MYAGHTVLRGFLSAWNELGVQYKRYFDARVQCVITLGVYFQVRLQRSVCSGFNAIGQPMMMIVILVI